MVFLRNGVQYNYWARVVTLPSVLTGHTWQIVYLSYTDPCPTIAIYKSEIKMP